MQASSVMISLSLWSRAWIIHIFAMKSNTSDAQIESYDNAGKFSYVVTFTLKQGLNYTYICDEIKHLWKNLVSFSCQATSISNRSVWFSSPNSTISLGHVMHDNASIYLVYLVVYSLHRNVLPTLQSVPLMTNGPLYPITQDSSCHGQHTMPRNPWSFPTTSSA